jgi:hypothetical protein
MEADMPTSYPGDAVPSAGEPVSASHADLARLAAALAGVRHDLGRVEDATARLGAAVTALQGDVAAARQDQAQALAAARAAAAAALDARSLPLERALAGVSEELAEQQRATVALHARMAVLERAAAAASGWLGTLRTLVRAATAPATALAGVAVRLVGAGR